MASKPSPMGKESVQPGKEKKPCRKSLPAGKEAPAGVENRRASDSPNTAAHQPAFIPPPVVKTQTPVKKAVPVESPSIAAQTGSSTAEPAIPFKKPAFELMTMADRSPHVAKEEDLLASAQHLEKTLADFGVQGKVVEIHPGPIITRFDYTPAPGIKVQAVAALSNDIAMAMKAMSVRILAPIPGKSAVGIELPNPKRAIVRLREILESADFQNHPSKLAIGLGKDAEGHPVIADLASMPHCLIAGSTGAGKSVCIHALIMSLMYRATPSEVKILMIDPQAP